MMTTDGGSHGRHGGTATYLLPPQAATGTGCEPDSDSPSHRDGATQPQAASFRTGSGSARREPS